MTIPAISSASSFPKYGWNGRLKIRFETVSLTGRSPSLYPRYSNASSATIAETSLAKSAREMLRNRIHHLPVVDHRDHLIGIISTMDILAEFADGEVD